MGRHMNTIDPDQSRTKHRDAFRRMSTCRRQKQLDMGIVVDDHLSNEEVLAELRKTDPTLTVEKAMRKIREADEDGDGKIEIEEFISLMTNTERERRKRDMRPDINLGAEESGLVSDLKVLHLGAEESDLESDPELLSLPTVTDVEPSPREDALQQGMLLL